MTLGKFLKSRLQEIGLTQEDIATQMRVSGAYINQVANDKGVPPTKDFCTRLAKEIDVEPGQLWKLVVPVRVTKALYHVEVTEKEAVKVLTTDIAATKKLSKQPKIPLVAYVSAGEPFECKASEFDYIELPSYLPAEKADLYYAVRVRGDSMQPIFKNGDTLFIKKNSRNDIVNNDKVIFRDNSHNCWVKFIQFSGEHLIFKSFNPIYPDIIRSKTDIIQMDKIECAVF